MSIASKLRRTTIESCSTSVACPRLGCDDDVALPDIEGLRQHDSRLLSFVLSPRISITMGWLTNSTRVSGCTWEPSSRASIRIIALASQPVRTNEHANSNREAPPSLRPQFC